jgi:hypothetical protein
MIQDLKIHKFESATRPRLCRERRRAGTRRAAKKGSGGLSTSPNPTPRLLLPLPCSVVGRTPQVNFKFKKSELRFAVSEGWEWSNKRLAEVRSDGHPCCNWRGSVSLVFLRHLFLQPLHRHPRSDSPPTSTPPPNSLHHPLFHALRSSHMLLLLLPLTPFFSRCTPCRYQLRRPSLSSGRGSRRKTQKRRQ